MQFEASVVGAGSPNFAQEEAWGPCACVAGTWFSRSRTSEPKPSNTSPIGPKVVPFWGSYLEFYQVIPKRNYFGAYGYGPAPDTLNRLCARRNHGASDRCHLPSTAARRQSPREPVFRGEGSGYHRAHLRIDEFY